MEAQHNITSIGCVCNGSYVGSRSTSICTNHQQDDEMHSAFLHFIITNNNICINIKCIRQSINVRSRIISIGICIDRSNTDSNGSNSGRSNSNITSSSNTITRKADRSAATITSSSRGMHADQSNLVDFTLKFIVSSPCNAKLR